MARIVYDAKRVVFGRSTGPSATIVVAHDKTGAVANYLLSINAELAKAWGLAKDMFAVVAYENGIDDGKPNGKGRRLELTRSEEGKPGAVCFRVRDAKNDNGAVYLSAKGFMRTFGLSKSITKSVRLSPSIDGATFLLALPDQEKK